MPKQTAPPAAPIRISTNAVLNGQFFNAYEPLPVARLEDLPDNFRTLVVTTLLEDEGPTVRCLGLNTLYQMTSDGRQGRRLRRGIAQREAEETEQEWIEEQIAVPLPPQVAKSFAGGARARGGLCSRASGCRRAPG